MGWLAIAQNEKYQLLSESNRVQLIPVPPRRGWIIDRNGKPIAINRASFRVDLIPQQIVNGGIDLHGVHMLRSVEERHAARGKTMMLAGVSLAGFVAAYAAFGPGASGSGPVGGGSTSMPR